MGTMKPSVLIKKGAEASLYLLRWHGRKAVAKKRQPKEYRPSALDEVIRKYRTTHEPQLLHEAKKAGVTTPIVYLVDVPQATIIMEFVEGSQLKQMLGRVLKDERIRLCTKMGECIGMLHSHGIVHGDLTTSNMILDAENRICFVDFGLGEKTNELEARAVDLHLMKRALQSTHFKCAQECLAAVLEGYSKIMGLKQAKEISVKMGEIDRRGRYVAERRHNMA